MSYLYGAHLVDWVGLLGLVLVALWVNQWGRA
jgi:hypothetical protein